jgi:hypothetical protein
MFLFEIAQGCGDVVAHEEKFVAGFFRQIGALRVVKGGFGGGAGRRSASRGRRPPRRV